MIDADPDSSMQPSVALRETVIHARTARQRHLRYLLGFVFLASVPVSFTRADELEIAVPVFVGGSEGNTLAFVLRPSIPRMGLHLELAFDPRQIVFLDFNTRNLPQGLNVFSATDRPGTLGILAFDPEGTRVSMTTGDTIEIQTRFRVPPVLADTPAVVTVRAIIADALREETVIPDTSVIIHFDRVTETLVRSYQAFVESQGVVHVQWALGDDHGSMETAIARRESGPPIPIPQSVRHGPGPHLFIDEAEPLVPGRSARYALLMRGGSGHQEIATITVTRELSDRPLRFQLYAPAPNPFVRDCSVRFDLPEAVPVRLDLLDISGRLATRVVDRVLQPGTHTIRLGTAHGARRLPPGIYFVRLRAGEWISTHKVIRIR